MRALFLCGFAVLAAVPARADITGMPPVTVICTLHQPFTREGVLRDMESCQPINLPRQATAAELSAAPSRPGCGRRTPSTRR